MMSLPRSVLTWIPAAFLSLTQWAAVRIHRSLKIESDLKFNIDELLHIHYRYKLLPKNFPLLVAYMMSFDINN